MAHQLVLDPHTSAKRTLAIVLGSIEVGLGVVRIKQAFEQRAMIVFVDGLNAIVYGLKAIMSGWWAEGESWLDLAREVRRIVFLYVRIVGFRRLLETVLEVMEHWGQD
jgi:hypothetical protein